MWDASKCDFCGDCLVQCRYADFDRDKAVREIKLLTEGKEAEILNRCITCVACSNNCPTGADPANLIFQMQEKIGTSSMVVNWKPVIEFMAMGIEGRVTPVELMPGDPDKPVLSFDAFEYAQFPEGTRESRLFKGMSIARGAEYMSLVGCVHMGGESFAKKYAARVIGKLAELGKDIVYIHNEGYILAHVKAKELGIPVPFKYQHLFQYLLDYLKNNRGDITPLGKKIAYQANCATRWIPEQDPWLEEIFALIGVERPARVYEKLNALCCSGPVLKSNRELAVEIQEKNVKDAIDCGAEAMITICPMCDYILRRPTSKMGLPKIFITDLCRIALGEISWPDK
jgi:Fe-S oxidoreductase